VGHVRLGQLPRTRRWNQVVALLLAGDDTATIAGATLNAAEEEFAQASRDEGVGRTAWLLTQLPLAARDPNYLRRLTELGLDVTAAPSVTELLGAFSDAVDRHMLRTGRRTDLGEMAQMAAAETLASVLTARTQSLFGSTPEDVRSELAALGTKTEFSGLARDFFSNLTRRYLDFFLSRELSNHVGGNRRFANTDAHSAFNKALDLHCQQASKIVEDFAGGWFSKANWEGGISPAKARAFTWTALKKLHAELRKGAVAA